jgi:RNA polymerase-binding transcription factor DksA
MKESTRLEVERMLREEAAELLESRKEMPLLRERLLGPPGRAWESADAAVESRTRDSIAVRLTLFERRVMQVYSAIDRLANNTYGFCMAKGCVIPDERLIAQPAAPLCVDCQHRVETDDPDQYYAEFREEFAEADPRLFETAIFAPRCARAY